MRNMYIIVFLAMFCVNATRCSNNDAGGESNGGGKWKLTPEWSSDMRVSYYEGGGMLNQYTRFEIYTDSASYTLHEDQSTNTYRFKFSKVELNAVAKVFYDNKFLSLKSTKHGVIYDKGTRSIMLCKGAECENKGDAATESYTGSDGDALNKIQSEVLAMVQKKYNQQPRAKVHVDFDKSLMNTKYQMKMQFAPGGVMYDSKTAGRLNETDLEMPAGSYNVNIYTYVFNPNAGTKYGPNANVTFSTADANTLTVAMSKDSMISIIPSKK